MSDKMRNRRGRGMRARAAAMVLGGLALVGEGCQSNITDRDIKYVELAEVRGLMLERLEGDEKRVVLMDSRPASAFGQGHLPTAVNARLSDFPPESRRQDRYTRFDHLIVYGEDPGSASAKALTKRLLELQYDDVRMFAGGIRAWRQAGLPLDPSNGAGESVKEPAGNQ